MPARAAGLPRSPRPKEHDHGASRRPRPTIDSVEAARYPIGRVARRHCGDRRSPPTLTDLKRRSRDFFWYSPILNEQLKDKLADVVVTPSDESEVIRVAAACAKHRIPLTVRGGATGNYGQCVPIEGGVVLDMAAMNAIEWQKPGMVRVQAGAKLWRHRRRDPAERLRTAHASLDQALGADRRLRRGRQRRRRQRHLRRHARARQHPRGAASSRWRKRRASSNCAATPRRRSAAPTAPPASSPCWKCRWRPRMPGST